MQQSFVFSLALIVGCCVVSGSFWLVKSEVIVSPDKGDDIELLEYAAGTQELSAQQTELRDAGVLDINTYSIDEPTHYAIGMLLDPCRNRRYDCCNDRFGEPAYTTATFVSEEHITLVDENNIPYDDAVSRLSDRSSIFDPDCYVDDQSVPYRLQKTHTTNGMVITKVTTDSGCIGRLKALAPADQLQMPVCWDRKDTIDAIASCTAFDGTSKPTCVAVAYMQTAYIVQCSGAYALDDHCGTFLEVHEPDNQEILSQTRLLGEYPSGFRTTTLPLFFLGDRTKTICIGDYEIWWVQRTRYNFIVQKKKKFHVIHPPCDFDYVTNTYKRYHQILP